MIMPLLIVMASDPVLTKVVKKCTCSNDLDI